MIDQELIVYLITKKTIMDTYKNINVLLVLSNIFVFFIFRLMKSLSKNVVKIVLSFLDPKKFNNFLYF